jgi:hypothetical protein
MRKVVGVLLGLSAGFWLRYSPYLLPQFFVDWVRNLVTNNLIVGSALAGMQFDASTINAIQHWLFVAGVVALPVLFAALLTITATLWLRTPKSIIASAALTPVLVYLSALHTRYLIAKDDPFLASSFWEDALSVIQAHFLAVVLFVALFSLLRRSFRSSKATTATD